MNFIKSSMSFFILNKKDIETSMSYLIYSIKKDTETSMSYLICLIKKTQKHPCLIIYTQYEFKIKRKK